MIGNTRAAALVSRGGSIDWLCLPRFDSPACFAGLLGSPENGRWLITSASKPVVITRRYRGDTMILETDFETEDGCVQVVDFMPVAANDNQISVVRAVRGIEGCMRMRSELIPRFEYGRIVPSPRPVEGGVVVISALNGVLLRVPHKLLVRDSAVFSKFAVAAGGTVPFVMTWHPAKLTRSEPVSWEQAHADTEDWWLKWFSPQDVVGSTGRDL